MAGRFEVHSRERWKLIEATDTTTGRPARLAHIRITERSHFLDGFEVEAMLSRVRALGDPRLATVICDDPVAFDGPANEPTTGRPEDWRRLGLDLLEVMILLNREGIRALPGWAWAERREGRPRPGCQHADWPCRALTRSRTGRHCADHTGPEPAGRDGAHTWQPCRQSRRQSMVFPAN